MLSFTSHCKDTKKKKHLPPIYQGYMEGITYKKNSASFIPNEANRPEDDGN
jgi:hypothetical protein